MGKFKIFILFIPILIRDFIKDSLTILFTILFSFIAVSVVCLGLILNLIEMYSLFFLIIAYFLEYPYNIILLTLIIIGYIVSYILKNFNSDYKQEI